MPSHSAAQDLVPNVFDRAGDRIDPLFWPSPRPLAESAWHGHVSFAHWLVATAQPAVLVELGTHNGVSLAAFCNAIEQAKISARCFAVDTWQGDAHAGIYGEEVYAEISQFLKTKPWDFVTLIRGLFDESVSKFQDRSIDILHIDGLHTYDAVKRDFETWRPKLSDRSIVLFHDTEIRDADFGVWALWSELTEMYPHFGFLHGSGLGVLATGGDVDKTILDLCSTHARTVAHDIRRVFETASLHAKRNGVAALTPRLTDGLRPIAFQGKNIALGCKSIQSSFMNDPKGITASATDGIKTGLWGFHTEFEDNPWWMVDLGSSAVFDEIVIYNRMDDQCFGRSRNLVALVSDDCEIWTLLYRHDGSVFGGADGCPLRIPCERTAARFVKLRLIGREYFHLDEVEVYDGQR